MDSNDCVKVLCPTEHENRSSLRHLVSTELTTTTDKTKPKTINLNVLNTGLPQTNEKSED